MNLAEKQSCISINMDHVLIEIPIIIERLEDLAKNMDDKFGWKEFKFCFKFATSHIVSSMTMLSFSFDNSFYVLHLEWDPQQAIRAQSHPPLSDSGAVSAG